MQTDKGLPLNGFICGDCMDYLPSIPDNYFDLAMVDPPYGIGYDKQASDNSLTKYGNAVTVKRDYRHDEVWDVKPGQDYFDELLRVSKRQIVWGGNYFADMLPPSGSFVVWDKRCGDQLKNGFADCEIAWCSPGMGVARVFRFVWMGMIQGNMKDKEDRFHPTQKPIALYRWLLSNYAKEGDRIIDTHVGSGSSLIACEDMGFSYLGFEISEDYYQKAKKRIDEFNAQLSFRDLLP